MQLVELIRVAQAQDGCITRNQALEVITKRQLSRFISEGVLERCWPSVYALAGTPTSWRLRARSALLSVPGAVLSHRCAAAVWGLTFVATDQIVLTAPHAQTVHRRGVGIHRSMQLDGFTTERDGLEVTTVARTLVDLSACLRFGGLGVALDQACNLGLVRLGEVDQCLSEMVTIGRKRITMMREHLAARTTTDERLETFLERKVLRWIRNAGLPEPEGQHWVSAGGASYRIDLAYPERKIAIEPDGPHHLSASVATYDRKRDADLALADWIVLHVTTETDPADLLSRLRSALRLRSHPSIET